MDNPLGESLIAPTGINGSYFIKSPVVTLRLVLEKSITSLHLRYYHVKYRETTPLRLSPLLAQVCLRYIQAIHTYFPRS